MIQYRSDEQNTLIIINHYAVQLDKPYALDFLTGAKLISSTDEALAAARLFWGMASLAADECINEAISLAEVDVEFWVHQFFNKLYSEMVAKGFGEQWKQADCEANG
jgi:hypothetical protein